MHIDDLARLVRLVPAKRIGRIGIPKGILCRPLASALHWRSPSHARSRCPRSLVQNQRTLWAMLWCPLSLWERVRVRVPQGWCTRTTHPHPPPSPEGRGCYAMPKKVCWTCTRHTPQNRDGRTTPEVEQDSRRLIATFLCRFHSHFFDASSCGTHTPHPLAQFGSYCGRTA